MMKLLPSWVPLALGGLLIAGLIGGYFVWRGQQREIGRQEVIAADAKAVAEQAIRDRDLSRQLVDYLQNNIAQREATAAPVREVIKYVTPSTCPSDAALDSVSEWVRRALAPEAGGSATRP
jgi:hypothetical protein